jgi:hypothetical protein
MRHTYGIFDINLDSDTCAWLLIKLTHPVYRF